MSGRTFHVAESLLQNVRNLILPMVNSSYTKFEKYLVVRKLIWDQHWFNYSGLVTSCGKKRCLLVQHLLCKTTKHHQITTYVSV